METFKFIVWEPVGYLEVDAESEEEATEKVEEYGYDDEDEGLRYCPESDGQEWELRRIKK